MLSFLQFFFQGCLPLGEKVDEAVSSSYNYGLMDKSKIYYSTPWFGGTPKELQNVDMASFRVLSDKWAKDKNVAYHGAERYTSVDAPSFTVSKTDSVSGTELIKDKNHVYYIDVNNRELLTILEYADPNTFVCIDFCNANRWAKDKNHVFCNWKIFDADAATFELINDSFAKDKDYLYAGYLEKIQKISVNTNQLVKISSLYVRTETDVYYCNEKFASFSVSDTVGIQTVFGFKWLKADGRLFFEGEPYYDTSIDVGSLEYMTDGYLKDKSRAYFGYMYKDVLTPIRGADIESFKPLGEHSHYAKDKSRIYYEGEVVEGANPQTFYYDRDKDYAYDGKKVYRDGKLVDK